MRVQTKDYLDVAARSRALGCHVPRTVALLPGNFSTAANADAFCFHTATPHVRAAWRSIGLEDEGPEARDNAQIGTRDLGLGTSSEQVPLVVYFGPDLLAGPSWRLPVALGLVSSVLATHYRRTGPRVVRLDVVVGRSGNCARIEYQGDAFGIVALTIEVRRIWADK